MSGGEERRRRVGGRLRAITERAEREEIAATVAHLAEPRSRRALPEVHLR
ncbi:hypothetical protein [Actinocorallia libanotica]|uniref:Uncharacterized protein n=1 Tax=Actinocorallia libanotica TaxID=46162 RepID=A0ABN1RNM5_9ACTN